MNFSPQTSLLCPILLLSLCACATSTPRTPKELLSTSSDASKATFTALQDVPLRSWAWDQSLVIYVAPEEVRVGSGRFKTRAVSNQATYVIPELARYLQALPQPPQNVTFVTTGDTPTYVMTDLLATCGSAGVLGEMYHLAVLDAYQEWRPVVFHAPEMPEALDDFESDTTDAPEISDETTTDSKPYGIRDEIVDKLNEEDVENLFDDMTEMEELNLAIFIQPDGHMIHTGGDGLPAQTSCPKDGPTLCLTPSDQNDKDLKTRALRYDYTRLHDLVETFRESRKNEEVVILGADPDEPLEVFALTASLLQYGPHPEKSKDIYSSQANLRKALDRPLTKIIWAVLSESD